MTHTLKTAFKEAAKLPEAEQEELASAVLTMVREFKDRLAV